ncbi:hypothetical protein BV898_00867 [Hypsibius exemplaris]|uniref:Uncharacterized protein n=1 Tax=Hypsibius exemplaris TaxID=2072580 RepID=A0A1W0XCP3_HYPEX|nr:hypothetical protein BV898_00867 [Hypsibius exemplaris]
MHIYREISSAQVKSPSNSPPLTKHLPAVPTRTSSLHMSDKSRAKVPVDLYERYLKSAYNPSLDPWVSSISLPGATSTSPPKDKSSRVFNDLAPRDNSSKSSGGGASRLLLEPSTTQQSRELPSQPSKTSRGFGDFYGGTLRDSLRRLSGRSRSPNHKTAVATNGGGSVIRVNIPESLVADQPRPPSYSVRARSNSFKENNNGWINVAPELSVKPASNTLQPLINVTIVHGGPQSPEPDYHNLLHPEKISGNGSLTVHSPGNQFATFSRATGASRNGGYRGSFREPTTTGSSTGRYMTTPELYTSSSNLPLAGSVPLEKSSRLSSLLANTKRSTSLSRAASQNLGNGGGAHSHSPSHHPRRPSPELKPVLKKRPQSQSGADRKKSVTFSDYTLVYT